MPALADRYTSVRVNREVARGALEADPLSYFRFGVPRLAQALSMFHNEGLRELHLRGPNKGGKTLSTAAFVTRCCQKIQSLDGVPLPQWQGPVEAVHLTLDFPQQVMSVRPAYMRLLGRWPHKAKPETSDEPLESLSIMPAGGDPNDRSRWSVIRFLSQKNMQSGKGVRADIVAFDEPPNMEILNELRKAPHAGRPGVRIIAETPIKRREWAPLRMDYGDCPRRSIRRLDAYRAEVRWSLEEVAPWVLSDDEKAELRALYALNPALADAREHGDYLNADLSAAFDTLALTDMMAAWCREPVREAFNIPLEGQDGRPVKSIETVVEWFKKPAPGLVGFMTLDPASGKADNQHNPLGWILSETGSGDLLARWNDKIPPFSAGILAATIARQFDAWIDIEMKDKWGVNVVRGVNAARYGQRLASENRLLSPGVWSKEVGWDANHENTKLGAGAIMDWILAFKSGIPYAKCPSREVMLALIDAELDDKDCVVSPTRQDGYHGEDRVCWGHNLARCVKRSNLAIPHVGKAPLTPNERLVAKMRAGQRSRTPGGGRLVIPQAPRG